jgi:hypothetical protein
VLGRKGSTPEEIDGDPVDHVDRLAIADVAVPEAKLLNG